MRAFDSIRFAVLDCSPEISLWWYYHTSTFVWWIGPIQALLRGFATMRENLSDSGFTLIWACPVRVFMWF